MNTSLKNRFALLTGLILLLFSPLIKPQITVPGIDGLTFNETGSDYTLQITTAFTLHNIPVKPASLWLTWKHAENTFIIYGSLQLNFDDDSINVTLGTINNPGLTIHNRQINSVVFEINSSFSLKGLVFHPEQIGFEWMRENEKYIIVGLIAVELAGDTITANIGDDIVPGIEINSGVIDYINITITQQFNVDGITIRPVALGLNWSGIQHKFKMFGSLALIFETDTIRTALGLLNSPGIEVTNGSIDFINISLSADFNLKGLKVSPQNLTFYWDKTASRFKIYGLAELKPGDDEMFVSLGEDYDPGIVISSGKVDTINIELIANFSLKGITFHPQNLAFHYSRYDSLYKIYGLSTLQIENDTLNVLLGNESSPGIKIKKGEIESVNIGVTASFNLKGINLTPKQFTFVYDKPGSRYVMFGTVLLAIEEDTFSVSLGTEAAPGVVISQSILEQVNVAFPAMFKLKGLSIKNLSAGFQWNRTLHQYGFYGGLRILFDSNEINASAGTPDYPGIKIVDGKLTDVNLSVSGDFHFDGVTFTPSNLYLSWSSDPSKFYFSGELKLQFDDEFIEVDLSDGNKPGIEIINGKIELIDISLTASFDIKGVTIHPSELFFSYSKKDSLYKIYGSLLFEVQNDILTAVLGNDSLPGIEIKNGTITEFNLGVTASFSLKSIQIYPQQLTFQWNKADDTFVMFGSIKIIVESDTISAFFGTESNPGVKIVNGEVTHVNIGVTADFKLKELSVKPNGLTIQWDGGPSGQDHIYKFFGDLFIEIDEQQLNASFGTFDKPGIIIHNGSVANLNIGIASDFKLGNIEVITKDLRLQYGNERYLLTGLMEIKNLWTATIDLGSSGNAGIELDVSGVKDKFILESLVITIQHAGLGAIDFKKIQLAFKNNTINEALLNVSFPPGWDIEGKILFTGNPAKVNSVSLSWEAENIDAAIEIPGTGVVVMKMDGTIVNLDNPANLYFHGDIGFAFGGPFTLDGKEVTMIYLQAGATVTHSEVKFTGDTYVGAYRTGDGKWHSILGKGNITIDLIWNKSYSIKGDFKVPSDPAIEAVLKAKINEHKNIDALLKVEFIVPHWVPIIHGKHFGSVDGAVRYINGSPSSSYAAAWVKVNLLVKHITTGVKYNFGKKSLSTIGSGTVSDIEKQIHHDIGNSSAKTSLSNTQLINSFIIEPKTPQMLYVSLDWQKEIDTAYITVLGPDGIMNLINLKVLDNDSSGVIPIVTTSDNITVVNNDSTAEFLLLANSLNTEDSLIEHASLTPGEYKVVLSYNPGTTQIDSLLINIQKYHTDPFGSIDVKQSGESSYEIDLNYYSYYPDSCIISVYANDSTAYSGKLISHFSYGTVDDSGFGKRSLLYSPAGFNSGSKIYFYYVIDDGINAPFYSEIQGGFIYTAPITGNVKIITPGDTLKPALLVYLDHSDNGYFDTQSTGNLEPACVTDKNGNFAFHNLSESEYKVIIVLPPGYLLDESSPDTLPAVINFTGSPFNLNFVIRKEN